MRNETKKGIYFSNRKTFSKAFRMALDKKIVGEEMKMLGVVLDSMPHNFNIVKNIMDATTSTVLAPSSPTPIQFTQYWVPSKVEAIVQAIVGADIFGIEVGGDITTQQIVRTLTEKVGQVYFRNPNSATIPVAGNNSNFEARDVQIFELGANYDNVDTAIMAKAMLSNEEMTRESIQLAHGIAQNNTLFYGLFDTPNTKLYGVLNDPNLLPYNNIADGAGGSALWADKTGVEIWNDILTMVAGLYSQSGYNIDPLNVPTKLVIASVAIQYLNKTNELFSKTVSSLLKETYPLMEVVGAPQFNGADAGLNAVYLMTSEEDKAVGANHVPVVFQPSNAITTVRGWQELYYSSTAGYFAVRPLFCYRASGL